MAFSVIGKAPSVAVDPFDGVALGGVGARVPDGGKILPYLEFVCGMLPISVWAGAEAAVDFVEANDIGLRWLALFEDRENEKESD